MQEDFRMMPMSTKVAQGDTAVLKCQAPRGYPEPSVTWVKNGEVLDPASSKRIRVTETGSLVVRWMLMLMMWWCDADDDVFRDAERSDGGQYYCRAENLVTTRDSDPARLSVHSESCSQII